MLPKRQKPGKQLLWTAGEIARLIGGTSICPRTVTQWINRGELKDVRLPGRSDRRVYVEELRKFLKKHGYYWALDAVDNPEGHQE